MNIGERKTPEYLTRTSNKCVRQRANITSNYAFSLNRAPCAKDRISERPIFSLTLLASFAFPVTRMCFGTSV